MRVILLIDMDSYFASVEQQSNPALRGRPVAVVGSGKRTVITTASYEARRFGVKTGMNMREAKKLCPGLTFVAGNNDKYTHVCERLVEIYSRYTSDVEVYSIDEAFLDITDSFRILNGPLETGRLIKKEIKQRFGLNATIGIGPNKLIAKLASDISKPDGLKWIKPGDLPGIFEGLSVDNLWGIGKKMTEKLNSLNIYTCGELGRTSASFLRSRFGIIGERLKLMGMGIDDSPVERNKQAAKSIGHSMTLPHDIWRKKDIEAYILKLSEMVGARARRHGLTGNVISVTIRYRDFETFSRQLKIGIHTNDTHSIFASAMKTAGDIRLRDSIRLLGIGLSGLRGAEEPVQLPLLREHSRRQDLLRTMDKINDRYGDLMVSWAACVPYRSRPAVISPAWRPSGIHRTRV
jgi:DNA polymerase-4